MLLAADRLAGRVLERCERYLYLVAGVGFGWIAAVAWLTRHAHGVPW